MITYLTGTIKVAKQTNRKSKEGVISYHTEVTIYNESIDKNQEIEINLDKVQLPIDDLTKLKNSIGKFIAVPFKTITTKNGTYTFPDDDLDYYILDKSPFEKSK